jgi:hypothetical protein
MAHDQEVVGSNPGTVYWMDVSNLLAITLKKIENKGSQMGHTKKVFLKRSYFYVTNSLSFNIFYPLIKYCIYLTFI